MRRGRTAGFTTFELVVVVGVVIILIGMAVPALLSAVQTYRAAGDARGLASQLVLTRMRAASEFTRAQLSVNAMAGTYQLQVCTTMGTSSCTTFTAEGGTQYLSSGSSFSYGSISTPPPGTQTTIGQSASILINSRGIPVDTTGAPTNYGIYVTDGAGHFYAATASASGRIAAWQYTSSGWSRL